MAQSQSKLDKAREMGYSDDQIMSFLAESRGFSGQSGLNRIEKSKSLGYTTSAIVDFLDDLPQVASPSDADYIPSRKGTLGSEILSMIPSIGEHVPEWMAEPLFGRAGPLDLGYHAERWVGEQQKLMPGIGGPGKLLGGAVEAVAGFAGGMTAPINVGIIAGMSILPSYLAVMAAGYFSAELAKHALVAIPEAKKKLEENDLQGAVELATEGILSSWFAVKSGQHAYKGVKRIKRKRLMTKDAKKAGLEGKDVDLKVKAEEMLFQQQELYDKRIKKADRQLKGRQKSKEQTSAQDAFDVKTAEIKESFGKLYPKEIPAEPPATPTKRVPQRELKIGELQPIGQATLGREVVLNKNLNQIVNLKSNEINSFLINNLKGTPPERAVQAIRLKRNIEKEALGEQYPVEFIDKLVDIAAGSLKVIPGVDVSALTGKKGTAAAAFSNIFKGENYKAIDGVLKEVSKYYAENVPELKKVRRDTDLIREAGEMVNSALLSEKSFNHFKSKVKKGNVKDSDMVAMQVVHAALLKNLTETAKRLKSEPSARNNILATQAAQKMVSFQQLLEGAKTEVGRTLRAARKLSESVDKFGYDRAIKLLSKQSVEVTNEIMSKIVEIPPGDKVALQKFVRDMSKYTSADKVSAYWYANILSAPATQMRNILGNAIHGLVLQAPTRFAAAAADVALTRLGPKKWRKKSRDYYFSQVLPSTFKWFGAIPRGMEKAWDVIKHGFDIEGQAKLETPRIYEFKGPLKPLNLASRSLIAVDVMFKHMAFESEMLSQAIGRSIKEGNKGKSKIVERAYEIRESAAEKFPEMVEAAEKFSRISTFTDNPDKIAQAAVKLRNLRIPKDVPLVGEMQPLRFVIPFINVPYSIIKQGIDLTPVGGLYKFSKSSVRNSPEGALVLGKALLGSTVVTVFSMFAATDRLTGAAPKSKSERDIFYRSGKEPYSIKIGDTWISYRDWGPLAFPMGIVAGFHDAFDATGDETDGERLIEAASTVGQLVLRGTFLGGLHSVLDASRSGAGLDRLSKNIVSGFIPGSSFWRNAAHALDPEIKDVQSTYEHVLAGLPLLSRKVAPRLDVMGDPVVREGGLIRSLTGMTFKEEVPKTTLDLEMSRLGVFPAKAQPNLKIKGQRVRLTPEEHRRYQKIRGDELKDRLGGFVSSAFYMDSGDARRARLLKERLDKAQRISTNAMKRILRDSRP
jgi:hypothetical protein